MSTSKQLMGSFSEPNVNFVYVCLVGNITPIVGCEAGQSRPSCHVIDNINEEVGTSKDDDAPIEVQRSAAYHELIDSCKKTDKMEKYTENIPELDSNRILVPLHINENSDDDNANGNPKILSLTGTKWLTESRDGSPDASKVNALTGAKVRRISRNRKGGFCTEPLLTRSNSDTSSASEDMAADYSTHKALSTVLALDRELNLFGLSNTYIRAGYRTGKKMNKGSKAVFHQTAIVQSCYKTCCRRRSRSDLPSSLKCGGCRSRCSCARCRSCTSCTSLCPKSCGPCTPTCSVACSTPCGTPCAVPCPLFWQTKPCAPKPCPPKPCPPPPGCCTSVCSKDCPRYGMEVSVIKKPKYDPVYSEIEPKSSCVLQKPSAARSCHHVPCCIPPSNCFPYLMPCFWPARSGAPCSEPGRCFHNPPCPRGRTPRSNIDPKELCPAGKPCGGKDKNEKCENYSCIGRNNEALAKALTEYNKKN